MLRVHLVSASIHSQANEALRFCLESDRYLTTRITHQDYRKGQLYGG
jgi:hypothetical protein